MFKFIRIFLFGRTKRDVLNETAKSLNVFWNAIDQLRQVNTNIEKIRIKNKLHIRTLQEDNEDYLELIDHNNCILNGISDFIDKELE